MTGITVQPIELVMGAGLAVVAFFLAVVIIGLGITGWRSARQALRDRRQRKLQLGGPR
jgi:hypothetical protein